VRPKVWLIDGIAYNTDEIDLEAARLVFILLNAVTKPEFLATSMHYQGNYHYLNI
jgi:hypothetical protein